jgi:hypothetical protein
MRGRFYAMLFIHFEPTGHSIRHGHGGETPDVQEQYKQASKDGVGGQSASNDGLPPYIMRYSPEEVSDIAVIVHYYIIVVVHSFLTFEFDCFIRRLTGKSNIPKDGTVNRLILLHQSSLTVKKCNVLLQKATSKPWKRSFQKERKTMS